MSTKITTGGVNYDPGSSLKYKTGSWRTMRPIVDKEKCKYCKSCYDFCPDSAVILLVDEKKVAIDLDYCKGCGICAAECKFDAIEMEEEAK